MPESTEEDCPLKKELKRRYGSRVLKKSLLVKRDRLNELFDESPHKQKSLAFAIGVNQGTISGVLSGKRPKQKAIVLWALLKELDDSLDLYDIAHPPVDEESAISALDYEQATEHVQELANVVTIVPPISGADLTSFYFPTSVSRLGSDEEPRQIDELYQFGVVKHVLIMGVAGQGKSLFLRRLALRSFKKRTSFPIFVELQSLRGQTIKSRVASELRAAEVEVLEEHIESLLKTGEVALFLDGLDEVSQDHRADVAWELESLHKNYPDLWLIISSRPGAGAEFPSGLTAFDIEPLQSRDQLQLAIRAYAEGDLADRVLDQLVTAECAVKELASNPLLLSFLVMHVARAPDHSLPKTLIDFYRCLPSLLIDGQNRFAGSDIRPITSGLQPDELRRFFGALCYSAMELSDSDELLAPDMEDAAATAMRRSEFSAPAYQALEDIARVTNLVLKRPGYYRFAHRELKFFFAASYVATSARKDSMHISSRFLEKWRHWRTVLSFLSEIDRSRYVDLFRAPMLKQLSPITETTYLKSFEYICYCYQNDDCVYAVLLCSPLHLDTRIGCRVPMVDPRFVDPMPIEMAEEMLAGEFVLIERGQLLPGGEHFDWDVSGWHRLAEVIKRGVANSVEHEIASIREELKRYEGRLSQDSNGVPSHSGL